MGIVAGMLGASISILLNTYANFIPTMQDQTAQLMDDILPKIQSSQFPSAYKHCQAMFFSPM
jgi:hypothetical protein